MSPHMSVRVGPGSMRETGIRQGRSSMRSASASDSTAYFDAEDVFAAGDRCTVRWRYRWQNDDGSEGSIHGVDVLRVRDGRVAEKFAYVKG